jgi:23S rRNA pseudouridine955/2504/2580 synthase
MKKITIDHNNANQRLDKFLYRYLGKPPKSFIHKMLRKKSITVNKTKAEGSYMLAPGDEVTFFVSLETLAKFSKPPKTYPKGHVDIIFEDENIILINKPTNLLTQPNEPNADSLIGRVTNIRKGGFVPVSINRLDRNTTGLVVCAKNLPAAQKLSKLMHDGGIQKTYLAVVHGRVKEETELRGFITKDKLKNISVICGDSISESKSVVTKVFPLSYDACKDVTCLKIHLETGRSHQIRAHLKSIGHPIAGDKKYGGKGAGRQLLHAYEIAMPIYNGKVFRAELPNDMAEYDFGIFRR